FMGVPRRRREMTFKGGPIVGKITDSYYQKFLHGLIHSCKFSSFIFLHQTFSAKIEARNFF
ncbi:MAG: hypothetical protein K2N16_04350, partial [Muribaculaceae bacterium]|nr:hypothetical protein [Muribaculaceae bacterium]